MNLINLCILYLLIGIVCAAAIYRRQRRDGLGRHRPIVHAVLALPLWPLWAPVILSETSPPSPGSTDLPARIEDALREGVEASSGSALQAMLNGESAARITQMTRRAAARHAELSQLLQRHDFCRSRARQRVQDAERVDSPRALATARLHLENVERLHGMAEHDRQVLQELAELAEALRTQLLMTRFAGSSGEGIGDILGDLWTRVEALSEAMDSHPKGNMGDGFAAHFGSG